MSNIEVKIKFIKLWYINECNKLSFGDKLKLARAWTNICIQEEEYEIAEMIQIEKRKIIKKHIKNKRRNRTFYKKIIIVIYFLKRKIIKLFN